MILIVVLIIIKIKKTIYKKRNIWYT
jgi:hypothetical protein